MSHSPLCRTALSVALLSLGIATTTALGQGTSTATGSTGSSASAPAGSTGAGSPAGGTGTTRSGTSAGAKGPVSAPGISPPESPKPMLASSKALAAKDRKFIEEAAKGGIAEVELANLAQRKASADEVKQFARRMADDHSKANEELKRIASAKDVAIPTALDAKEKREMDRLEKLSGADFDREYMKHMVSDHKKDLSEFRSTAKSAKDADVKNFASSTVPTLEQHLSLAQSAENAARKGQGAGASRQSSTGSASQQSSAGSTSQQSSGGVHQQSTTGGATTGARANRSGTPATGAGG